MKSSVCVRATGNARCITLSAGGDKDVMGIQTVAQDVPVIDARGMRPEEVLQALEGKWQ